MYFKQIHHLHAELLIVLGELVHLLNEHDNVEIKNWFPKIGLKNCVLNMYTL